MRANQLLDPNTQKQQAQDSVPNHPWVRMAFDQRIPTTQSGHSCGENRGRGNGDLVDVHFRTLWSDVKKCVYTSMARINSSYNGQNFRKLEFRKYLINGNYHNMEQIFLKQILAEPEYTLHPLIYADWLEEQGSPKAAQIRAWCEARKSLTEETVTVLINLVGDFEKILNDLNEQCQRLCACELALRVLHCFEDQYSEDSRPRQVILSTWNYAHGTIGRDDWVSARDAAWKAARIAGRVSGNAGVAARAAARSADNNSWIAAWGAAEDASWIGGNTVQLEKIVLASSYLLFGGNALPDRIQLENDDNVTE